MCVYMRKRSSMHYASKYGIELRKSQSHNLNLNSGKLSRMLLTLDLTLQKFLNDFILQNGEV